MKRKSNLFYLSGDDSRYISFSNYGESLTGNFLATDWKLFPSKFICMYIKYLDVENEDTYNARKTVLIKYLASYYENKLAFLRDYCIDNSFNIEKQLLPLNYLLEALYRMPEDIYNMELKDIGNISGNNDDVMISFIGDITEQDYNGTYTDTINIITSGDIAKGDIILADTDTFTGIDYNNIVTNTTEREYLYGWTEPDNVYGTQYCGPTYYKDVKPVFDKDSVYYIKSFIKGLSTTKHEDSNIKFNIIIPLYDLININKDTNVTNIVEDEKIIINDVEQNGIDLSDTNTGYIKNVPMGMWFSDEVIELKRNKETGYAPSWSLLLSSQFKPFPYSQKIPTDITQDSTKESYATYAQILIRQNKLLDILEKLENNIVKLNKRIDAFETRLNSSNTTYTFDNMQREMINFQNHVETSQNAFKNEIYSYIANNWKGYIS